MTYKQKEHIVHKKSKLGDKKTASKRLLQQFDGGIRKSKSPVILESIL